MPLCNFEIHMHFSPKLTLQHLLGHQSKQVMGYFFKICIKYL